MRNRYLLVFTFVLGKKFTILRNVITSSESATIGMYSHMILLSDVKNQYLKMLRCNLKQLYIINRLFDINNTIISNNNWHLCYPTDDILLLLYNKWNKELKSNRGNYCHLIIILYIQIIIHLHQNHSSIIIIITI